MALTELKIKSAKAADKRYSITDADGLILEVMTSGKKYWRLRYNVKGKRYFHTIGEYPALSLAEARDRKIELRQKIRDGKPLKETRKTWTFGDVANEWAKKHVEKLNNEAERKRLFSRLDAHILPFIGDAAIADISAPDILPVLQRLETRGTLEMASKVRVMLGQIFRYAVSTGRKLYDPMPTLKGAIAAPRSRHFASLTNPRDVANLMQAIDNYPQKQVRYAMIFSALTFCRPGEIRRAEWSEINIANREWRLPAEKMKMKRPHIVPLASQTIELLADLHVMTGNGMYLFPSNRSPRGDRPMSENTVLVALRSMGYGKEQMTAHGFRSMASTLLNENGFNRDWIERQLAHVEGNNVRAAYNYAEYLPERRKMMQWWADYLDELRGSH